MLASGGCRQRPAPATLLRQRWHRLRRRLRRRENPRKPTDFAFVEPKYSVKEGKADDKAAAAGGQSAGSGEPLCRQDGGGTGCHAARNAAQAASAVHGRFSRRESGGGTEGADGAQKPGDERVEVYRRADLGQPQRCGPERLLPPDSRDQRIERGARSHDPRQPDDRAR